MPFENLDIHLGRPAWADLYAFTLEPNFPVDYTFANSYHSHSPDSPFTQRLICTMPTLNGGTIFTDRRLKIRSDGTVKELHVKDEEEFKRLLQQHFWLTIKNGLSFVGKGGL